MRTPSHAVRVVHYPVEPGSETTVPLRLLLGGPPTEVPQGAPKIFWLVGFGEDETSALAAATKLHAATGMLAMGVRFPFAEVVKKSSNVRRGLDHFMNGALPYAAGEVAPERPAFFGGNSLGGFAAMVASREAPVCKGLGVLSPLVANRALGRTLITRELTVTYRLVVKSAWQNYRLRQEGLGMVLQGAGHDAREMGLMRFPQANAYAFSNRTGNLALEGACRMREAGHPVAIFSPEDDRCFYAPDYANMLGAVGCADLIHPVPGPHATMVSRAGQEQLTLVGQWLAGQIPAER